MENTETKYFTRAEAQKTLPLVKQIVRDILNNAFQVRTIAESLGGKIEGNEEVAKLADEIDVYINELRDIGCYYKDWSFDVGLVDFPAILNGEKVELCWRSDEDQILYYHKANEGFAGRKLIPDENL
ncbi:MAG: DUF2203 domain-containing protein [Melioribacteraceae bacterium]|nr:DUF2203 domain-containing protein [Melioribacteraceae bacterium]